MEALVRIVDRTFQDFRRNETCLKRGDVIHIAPNGHKWSDAERNNPQWRIIKLPDDEDIKASLLAHDMPPDNVKEYILRPRQAKINLDALSVTSDDKLARNDKAIAAVTTKAQLVSLFALKTAPKEAVDVIGPIDPAPDVIGPK